MSTGSWYILDELFMSDMYFLQMWVSVFQTYWQLWSSNPYFIPWDSLTFSFMFQHCVRLFYVYMNIKSKKHPQAFEQGQNQVPRVEHVRWSLTSQKHIPAPPLAHSCGFVCQRWLLLTICNTIYNCIFQTLWISTAFILKFNKFFSVMLWWVVLVLHLHVDQEWQKYLCNLLPVWFEGNSDGRSKSNFSNSDHVWHQPPKVPIDYLYINLLEIELRHSALFTKVLRICGQRHEVDSDCW